jgi:tetratricopeptide (TPR) repeat protein
VLSPLFPFGRKLLKLQKAGLSISIAAVAILLSSFSFRGFVGTAYSKQSDGEPVKASARIQPADTLNRDGFEHFYNMEYDAAIHDFELALQAAPDDPSAANHLLQAILTRELCREGALDAELYFNDGFFHAQRVSVDPNMEARIRELTARALQLCTRRLKVNPNDVDALYARGVTRALDAGYMGLVEKSWLAALRSGLGSYKDHENVLRLSPGYTDAKFVVGLYSYAIGSLPWPERAAAFLLAFSGNKSKGSEYVAQAAAGGGETSVDAKAALALILVREHHSAESISLMAKLSNSYPHNFLFAMTVADVLKASGQIPEAVTAYQKLLRLGGEGMFPGARLEHVAYKLGESLRLQGNYSAAAEAFGSVSSFPHAEPELVSKATLAVGEMYDLLGQRNSAVKKYQELIAVRNNSSEAKTARQLLNHPYRIP